MKPLTPPKAAAATSYTSGDGNDLTLTVVS